MNSVNKREKEKQKLMKVFMRKKTIQSKSPQLSKTNMDLLLSLTTKLSMNYISAYDCVLSKDRMTSKYFLEGDAECVYSFLNYDKIDDVKPHIIQTVKEGIHTSLDIDGRKVNIYIMFPQIYREKIMKHHKKYIQHMVSWLKLAFSYAKKECSQTLDIYLFLSDLIKTLPISPQPLNTIHVNSAFTTSCMPSTRIIIYRYEEWFKVFIHETIHCLGLDFSVMETKKYDDLIKKIYKGYNKSGDLRLYESYCEMWGEIINILFCALSSSSSSSKTKKGNSRFPKKIHKNTAKTPSAKSAFRNHSPQHLQKIKANILKSLHKECIFSLYQTSKVLSSQNISYEDLTKGNLHQKYNEKTSSLSYYIIKYLLMENIDDFLKWCISHNTPYVIPFTNEGENIHEYINLIEGIYDSNHTMNLMLLGKEYEELAKEKYPDKWITHTLRMSFNDCLC